MTMTRALLGLLTRIKLPGSVVDLETAAKQQYLFPLVGLLVGLIAALFCVILGHFFDRADSLVSGGLLIAGLYVVTGIIHTEGLADVADGVMARGNREAKLSAMKDPRVGVAAVVVVVVYLLIFFALAARICARAEDSIGLSPLPWEIPIAFGFVVSEISGKLAMNTSMLIGPSAHPGMGAAFVKHASSIRFVIALVLALGVGVAVAGFASVILFAGVAAGAGITIIARKHFNGVSGDVFGAANETGRLLALILWMLII